MIELSMNLIKLRLENLKISSIRKASPKGEFNSLNNLNYFFLAPDTAAAKSAPALNFATF